MGGLGGWPAPPQPVRRQRRIVVALPFQRERLIQIIETLGGQVVGRRPAEEATPETHVPKIACGVGDLQCSFPFPWPPVPTCPPRASPAPARNRRTA